MYVDYGVADHKEALKLELTCFINIFTKTYLHELEQQYILQFYDNMFYQHIYKKKHTSMN